MSENGHTELLEQINALKDRIAQLSGQLKLWERFFRICALPPFLSSDKEDLRIWLRQLARDLPDERFINDEWIERNRGQIRSVVDAYRCQEIPNQDATLFHASRAHEAIMALSSVTTEVADFLASRVLLGSCECGRQLQLLIESDTLYLTCPRCGRWLWQRLTRA
jgi:hypothetical protein